MFVIGEAHGVLRTPLRHGTQRGSVAEHLRQRYVAAHNLRIPPLFHPFNPSAPGVDVTHDIAQEVIWVTTSSFITGSRITASLAARFLETGEPAILGQFRRIHFMIGTIHKRYLDIHQEPRHDTSHHGLFDSRSGRCTPSGLPANDLVLKDKSGTALVRLNFENHMAVLVASRGLAHELAFGLTALVIVCVGNLRFTYIRPHFELSQQAVHDDLQVQFLMPAMMVCPVS